MSKKIYRSIIAVSMVVLVVGLIITNSFLYDYFNKSQVSRLKDELSLVQAGVENMGEEYLNELDSSIFRFTLISPNGEVLYDSVSDTDEMDNHSSRDEILQAFETGSGSSARYSSTLTQRTFYEAVLLSSGNVLRISATQVTIGTLIMGMAPAICAIVLTSIVIAMLLSQKIASSIVNPLENLDLDDPENNEDTYEELTPVLSRLNRQHNQILRQMREQKQKSDEFELVTSSMKEGLVLLDKKGMVISINNAARELFKVKDEIKGQNFLIVDRSSDMNNAVCKALSGEHSDFLKQIADREYQVLITPTESEGEIIGAVILCIDVSEAMLSQRSREEFTANVSHELKTPLQSIIGSAELLQSGLVKADDTVKFVDNIRSEALRLVELINDIIRLSELDENKEQMKEPVDLCEVVNDVVASLGIHSEKNNVSISVSGEKCVAYGVKRYFYETIYNLCDNAIRYNRQFGKVEITLKKENGNAIIVISDTGIGIPLEDQPRVFERFYRVDKSHSKSTGGTGLGLSIVKHAVICNGGTINLESREGEGTNITLTFKEM